MTKLYQTKQKVTLSKTQRQVLVAMKEAFDTNDRVNETIPVNSDPRREGESWDEHMARLKASPRVKTVTQWRINIPNTRGGSWRKFAHPNDPTMKTLVKLGLVIDHSHREFALTEAGHAALAGSVVFKTVAVQPKRVEFTITPAQAIEDERKAQVARIVTRTNNVVEYAESFIGNIERYTRDFKHKVEKFQANPERMLVEHEESIAVALYHFVQALTQNSRIDTLIRNERELVALFKAEGERQDDGGLSLQRVEYRYPEAKDAPGVAATTV